MITRHLTWVVVAACLVGALASAARAADRNKHGPSKGPEGGDAFSDGILPAEAEVVGVKVRHGDLIDSVELLYKTGKEKVVSLGRHGGDGGDESVFMLEEGEHIKGHQGRGQQQDLASSNTHHCHQQKRVLRAGRRWPAVRLRLRTSTGRLLQQDQALRRAHRRHPHRHLDRSAQQIAPPRRAQESVGARGRDLAHPRIRTAAKRNCSQPAARRKPMNEAVQQTPPISGGSWRKSFRHARAMLFVLCPPLASHSPLPSASVAARTEDPKDKKVVAPTPHAVEAANAFLDKLDCQAAREEALFSSAAA